MSVKACYEIITVLVYYCFMEREQKPLRFPLYNLAWNKHSDYSILFIRYITLKIMYTSKSHRWSYFLLFSALIFFASSKSASSVRKMLGGVARWLAYFFTAHSRSGHIRPLNALRTNHSRNFVSNDRGRWLLNVLMCMRLIGDDMFSASPTQFQ